ncbi:MAE_28990/MAE_18760 family HEPN-like nuclease [Clostridium perfringens]
MFSEIRSTSTSRLIEVREYLDKVESSIPIPPLQPSNYDNICKGLFFVYIYGIYEYTIVKTILKTIELINNEGPKLSECKVDLLCLILNDEYNSISSVGANKRWEKRWDINKKILENNNVMINTSIIPTDGKNYRYSQLKSVWTSFGIESDIIPRQDIGGRIEEMVNFRNYIAHGDKTPADIGRGFTITDLRTNYDAINLYCTYIVDVFEDYVKNKKYLKQ